MEGHRPVGQLSPSRRRCRPCQELFAAGQPGWVVGWWAQTRRAGCCWIGSMPPRSVISPQRELLHER